MNGDLLPQPVKLVNERWINRFNKINVSKKLCTTMDLNI